MNNSFDANDEEIRQPVKKIGLKNNNKQVKPTSSEIRSDFEKNADGQFSKIEEYKKKVWELSIQYKSFIENKTLAENKGPIASNIEKEVLDKLVQLASEMNEDSSQPEGIGGIALNMLLMKCMLLQRDMINMLSFKVEQLEKNNK